MTPCDKHGFDGEFICKCKLDTLREEYVFLRNQIDRLASFITDNILGEPSRSEGAVDTAIRLLQQIYAPPSSSK